MADELHGIGVVSEWVVSKNERLLEQIDGDPRRPVTQMQVAVLVSTLQQSVWSL